MKRNIFYIFCLSLFLALPLAAQEAEKPQRVNIPDYFPSETLSADMVMCFMPGIHLTPEQVEICREAHRVFYRELKIWIENAENEGFINQFTLPTEEKTQDVIDYISNYNYTAATNELLAGSSVITAFQILKTTRDIALGITPEESQEKAKKYRTSTPLDVFMEGIDADTPSLFKKIYGNSLTAPYLKTVMKTIRIDAFHFGPLGDYLEKSSKMSSDLTFVSLNLNTVIPQLNGSELSGDKKDYFVLLSQAGGFLSILNSTENKYKKVLKGENSTPTSSFGSFTF